MSKVFNLFQTAIPQTQEVFIRDLPKTITIASIEDLLALRRKHCQELIVNEDSIEIYNWYRE